MDPTTYNCGLFWSDGKFQRSVCPSYEKHLWSEFDHTCGAHDCALSSTTDYHKRRLADNKFYYANIKKGLKRAWAAKAVKYINPIIDTMSGYGFNSRDYDSPRVRFNVGALNAYPSLGRDKTPLITYGPPTPEPAKPAYLDPPVVSRNEGRAIAPASSNDESKFTGRPIRLPNKQFKKLSRKALRK